MELETLRLPAGHSLAAQYMKNEKEALEEFHYLLATPSVYEDRVNDLKNRNFDREALVLIIKKYMESFPSSEQTDHSLKKLADSSSVVVIGGQQAGILSGPLYTIHKIISILLLAKEQEEKLGIPVVPVFWIAGEDHDFDEINHIYSLKNVSMEKQSYPVKEFGKKMASQLSYDKEIMSQFTDKVLGELGETPFTNELRTKWIEAIHKTDTFTDFFSYFVMDLFKEFGLLVIDSAYAPLRQQEIPFFEKLIDESNTVTHKVLQQQRMLKTKGYAQAIEIQETAANLFLEINGERTLLDHHETGYMGRQSSRQFTTEELKMLLHDEPALFSNNVVTRPLMQEYLFPTLAFIGGPGEISYWTELKGAFEHLQMKMPPIVPRLNITYLEREIESDLLDQQLNLLSALQNGVENEKKEFINSVHDQELDQSLLKVKESIVSGYLPVLERVAMIDKGLIDLATKNKNIQLDQIDFLRNRIRLSLERKHHEILKKYDRLETSLHPDHAFQERMWNVSYFLNRYGLDFVKDVMSLDFTFDGTHQIVKL
jgi:bacillithiol biosynthesis cysteine-adding enzyme BshC